MSGKMDFLRWLRVWLNIRRHDNLLDKLDGPGTKENAEKIGKLSNILKESCYYLNT